ncbi:MAG TPA: hypothetical protein VHB25_00475 [Gemmatimonadaceae bacterium]|nr:hypothetical protein [Gemmatimonadaceae bacterium]
MSDAEHDAAQRYGAVIVVGGGCYGGYYVRQLRRAAEAGAVTIDRLVVVDRDPECAVASEAGAAPLAVELVVANWRAFFHEYLADAARHPEAHARDAIVPSPLMPHLMGEWLVDRARERVGSHAVAVLPVEHVPPVPWQRAGADGTHYVSFATWECPVNCVEPRTCPHTRGPRDWSLPVAIARHAERERQADRPIVSAVLHCRHRAYGVGMFDTAEVVDADRRIAAASASGAADVLIGTVSHCHGALTRFVVGGASSRGGSRGR